METVSNNQIQQLAQFSINASKLSFIFDYLTNHLLLNSLGQLYVYSIQNNNNIIDKRAYILNGNICKNISEQKRNFDNINNHSYHNFGLIDNINQKSDSKSKEKEKNNKILFVIKKTKKKGRRFKQNRALNNIKHSKFTKDNLIQKIKRKFINSTMKLINKKYNEFLAEKNLKPKKLLHKINSKFSMMSTYRSNFSYMQRSVGEMFSEKLSDKIKNYDKDYNRKSINKIYEQNKAKDVIDLLNLSVKDMYKVYIGINDRNIPEYGLEYDLIKISEINKEEEYGKKYKNVAMNLLKIIGQKTID